MRFPFTITGRMLIVSLAFCLLALLDDSLVGLFSYLLWMLICAFACGLFFRPQLTARLLPVPLVRRGESFLAIVEVTNRGNRPAYDVACSLVHDSTLESTGAQPAIGSLGAGRANANRISVASWAARCVPHLETSYGQFVSACSLQVSTKLRARWECGRGSGI